MAIRAFNEAIYRETGIENIACMVEKPTLDSFNAICKNENTRLLLVTGGPMVVKAAMQTGKRAICAGPGNPPVFVDDTCCANRAAKAINAMSDGIGGIGNATAMIREEVSEQRSALEQLTRQAEQAITQARRIGDGHTLVRG